MKLAINGFARSGKDTLAKAIAKHEGISTYALADPIKEFTGALFDWNEDQLHGSLKEVQISYSITVDTLEAAANVYQKYGLGKYEAFHDCWEKLIALFKVEFHEEYGRYTCYISPRQAFQKFGTDWGRKVCDTIWLDIAPKDNVIITDIRFDNEATYFKDLDFKVIGVVRENLEVYNINKHESEQGINSKLLDLLVHNNGSVKDLVDLAERISAMKYQRLNYYSTSLTQLP